MSATPVARLAATCSAAPAADADLLARYATGRDEAAFAALVRRHGPMVRAVARRAVRDAHLADDVAQAVFLVLARKAGRLARPDRLAGWLFGVARRLAARAIARRPAIGCRPLRDVPAPSGPAPGWNELLAVLDTELARLPEAERAALVLCYLEGRTRDEAARACGWSVRTLRRRLADGRSRLRSRLARRGLGLGAALAGLALTRDGLTAGLPPLVAIPAHPTVETLARTELRPRWPAGLAVALGTVTLVTVAAGFPWPSQGPPPASDPPKAARPALLTANADLPPGAVALLGSPNLRHPDSLSDLRFSPDGRELISYGHGKVRRWDVRTGAAVRPPGPSVDIRTMHADMQLTADLKRVVGPYVEYDPVRYSIREYDVATGRHRELVALPAQTGLDGRPVYPTRFATSPDGNLVAERLGTDVYLWDLKTAKVRHHLKPPGGVLHLAFTPDGAYVVTAGADRLAVRLWDVTSGREAETLTREGTTATVAFLGISPDGRWVAAAENIQQLGVGTAVAVWDRTAHGPPSVLTLADGLGPTSTMAFAPDAPTLYCVSGGRPRSIVTVWDVVGRKRVARWEVGPTDGWSVKAAVAPRGGPLAIGWQFGVIHLHDTKTGAELVAPAGHPDTVAAVAFTADGVRTIGADGSTATWDAKTGALRGRKDLPAADRRGDNLAAVAATPDGRLVLTRVENRAGLKVDPPFVLSLWDAGRAEKKHEWVVDAFTSAVGLTPDGTYAVAQAEKDGFRVFATADGREVAQIFRPHKAWQLRFTLPADGKTLIVCDDEAVDGFDLATGKRRFGWKLADQAVLAGTEGAAADGGVHVRAIAAGPAGKTLVLSLFGPYYTDRAKRVDSLVLVEAETGAEIRRARLPDGAPVALAVSPDGRWVAGNGAVWDGTTLAEVRRFPDWPRVTAVGFRRDGRHLITGREDGTSMVWRLGD